jgi:hypothetical protein
MLNLGLIILAVIGALAIISVLGMWPNARDNDGWHDGRGWN